MHEKQDFQEEIKLLKDHIKSQAIIIVELRRKYGLLFSKMRAIFSIVRSESTLSKQTVPKSRTLYRDSYLKLKAKTLKPKLKPTLSPVTLPPSPSLTVTTGVLDLKDTVRLSVAPEAPKTPDLYEDTGKGVVGASRPSSSQIEAIYAMYPRKTGAGAAKRAIRKALSLISHEYLLAAVTEYSEALRYKTWKEGDKKWCPAPATWFNQERWNDDRDEWRRTGREHTDGGGSGGLDRRLEDKGEYGESGKRDAILRT